MERCKRNGLLYFKSIKDQALEELEKRGAPRHIIEGLRMLNWNALPPPPGGAMGSICLTINTFRDAYDWEAFIQGLMGNRWSRAARN